MNLLNAVTDLLSRVESIENEISGIDEESRQIDLGIDNLKKIRDSDIEYADRALRSVRKGPQESTARPGEGAYNQISETLVYSMRVNIYNERYKEASFPLRFRQTVLNRNRKILTKRLERGRRVYKYLQRKLDRENEKTL